MATIVLRAGKGSPLTNAEVDANFSNLNTAVVDAAVTASWASVSGKPATLAGYGITDAQALDADLTAIAALVGTSGFLKKTAANTWALDTATYLTGNQGISYTGDATGSGTTSVALTLANSGVTAGTYPKVTVDAKGRVTAGAALVASDVPTLNQSTTGNAATATTLQTARTLTLGNTGKTFNGSANVAWTLAEIGALPLTGGTLTGQYLDFSNSSPSLRIASGPGTFFIGDDDIVNLASGAVVATPSSRIASGVAILSTHAYDTDQGDNKTHFGYYNGSGYVNYIRGAATYFASTTVQFAGNQALHAGNYNNYAPTLTGTNASGTWGINVTGNAATASNAVNATNAWQLGSTTASKANALQYWQSFGDSALNPSTGWYYAFRMSHGDADTYYSATIALDFHSDSLLFRRKVNGVHQSWRTVLHDGNYNSYAPTLTGTGASGTWGIGVTGNAATATKLINLRTINGVGFDGTANITVADSTKLPLTGGTVSGATTFSADVNMTSAGSYLPGHFYTNTWDGSNVYFHVGGPGSTTNKILNLRVMNSSGGGNSLYQFDVNRLDAPNLQINGNQVLHASNFNSYAPTLTGAGASGSWGISVTGAAASATRIIFADGPRNLSDRLPNSFMRTVNWDFVNASTGNGTGAYAGVMSFSPWAGTTASTGDSSYQLAFANQSGINASGQPKLSIRNGIDTTWNAWYTLLHSGNYNSYSPTLTGTGASGTWGINVTGSSASVSGLTLTSSANGINPDSVTQNQLGYITSVGLFGQTDGGLYSSAYDSTWIHQIFGDFRTGQLAVRGKNSGTWQSWRAVLDSSNYNSYAPTLTGTGASGTWGISVTGNAATATTASQLGGITSSRALMKRRGRIHPSDSTSLNSSITSPEMGFTYGGSGEPSGPFIAFGGLGGDIDYACQLVGSYSGGGNNFVIRTRNDDTVVWNPWRTLITDGNYSSYALPLTGGTVEGTANIRTSITKQYHYVRHIEGKNWDTYSTGGDSLYLNYLNNQPVYIGSGSNLVLHAGNYNSYAPSLGGSGAAGTWAINVTGTAAGLTGTPNLGFSSSGGSVGVASQGGPQIQGQGGGAAMMSFHRPGAYGINFGLNSDNVLCTGGWSRAGTHIVLDTGNIGTYAVPLSGATMSGSLTIRNGSPTLFLQDTDHISAMLHCNGSKVYILRGSGADSTTWTQLNGEWPVYWDLTTNAARFGGAVHAVGAVTTNYGFNSDSDERIKENWSNLSADFVEQLANVKCGTYDRIDINIGRRQVGVSAQSLQALMPEAVDYNEERDRLSVSYGNAALSSAVELAKRVVKQCKEIDDLKDRVVKLESLINKLIGD